MNISAYLNIFQEGRLVRNVNTATHCARDVSTLNCAYMWVIAMSDPCDGCTRPQCHDADLIDPADIDKINNYVQSHDEARFCMVDITDC